MEKVTMKSIELKESIDYSFIEDLWEKLVHLEKVNPLDEGKYDCFKHYCISFLKKNNKKPTIKDIINTICA